MIKLVKIIISIAFFILFTANVSKGQYGTLKIKWAGVIDNGEGDDCPHGPFGKLYVLIYPSHYNCPGSRKSYNGYLKKKVLNGPSSGKYCKVSPYANYEWLDGDALQMETRIYNWVHPNQEILVVIYESDGSEWKGIPVPGRSHDMLFCYQVSRQATMNDYIVLGDRYRTAKDGPIINCRRSGITWHYDVWSNGLNRGIPKMFIQVTTEY